MQLKKKQFFVLCTLCMLLVLAGCEFSRETMLEDSGHEMEIFTGKGNASEDAVVITGQITEDVASDDVDIEASNQDQTDTSSSDTADSGTDMIYVHICGQVVNPGVYQVPIDARVFSVIRLAGGLTEDANEAGVNQAQNLVDGQMIYIPAVGEEIPLSSSMTGQGSSASSADNSKVNINTADLETLMSLPGIGEGKAQSILAYRQEHGSFQSIEDIMNVEGIKEGTYSKFKDKITI